MISFVYLDVGGVANIDFSGNNKWDELRRDLGITPETRAAYDAIWAKYWPTVCTTFDVEKLVPIFREELGLDLPPDYSLLDDFVRRFEPNPSIWPVAEEMKRSVPVGLLTNMYIGMLDGVLKAGMLPPIDWDVIIDSTAVVYQKPDLKIFEIAQAKAGVPGNQILFADNSAEHVEAAKRLGWQTFLYDQSDRQTASRDLLQYFRQNLHSRP